MIPSRRAVTQHSNRARFLATSVAIGIAPDTHRDQAAGERGSPFALMAFANPEIYWYQIVSKRTITFVWLPVTAPVQNGLTTWAIPSLTSGRGTSTTFNHSR
jgi:hypothetical protein